MNAISSGVHGAISSSNDLSGLRRSSHFTQTLGSDNANPPNVTGMKSPAGCCYPPARPLDTDTCMDEPRACGGLNPIFSDHPGDWIPSTCEDLFEGEYTVAPNVPASKQSPICEALEHECITGLTEPCSSYKKAAMHRLIKRIKQRQREHTPGCCLNLDSSAQWCYFLYVNGSHVDCIAEEVGCC